MPANKPVSKQANKQTRVQRRKNKKQQQHYVLERKTTTENSVGKKNAPFLEETAAVVNSVRHHDSNENYTPFSSWV